MTMKLVEFIVWTNKSVNLRKDKSISSIVHPAKAAISSRMKEELGTPNSISTISKTRTGYQDIPTIAKVAQHRRVKKIQ